MNNLPQCPAILLAATTLATVYLFYKAARHSRYTLIVLLAWLAIQTPIALSGFYTVTDPLPPRFLLLIGPPFLLIITLFLVPQGRRYLDSLNPKILTLLHTVRIPVELILFYLFIERTIPELMTFEGRNYDILSGLSAPFVYYFGMVKKKLSRGLMLAWHFICLGLLVNIVTYAVLSAPFPFQRFAFDQPNVAVLYFPFIWLPCCIVPLVLLSHLAVIRQLLKKAA